MRRIFVASAAAIFLGLDASSGSTPWGKDYFPNTILTTHDGKEVRFFDDLIEGKIVVINFIYTYCPDTCPLETAQLVKVQNILGDRIGKDVFFYSISLDPERDTPAVLKDYRERFHAKWTFLTGKEEEIFELQKKLGLFLEEIKDGLNNHNVNMIIGNQATGRWMKRSPHENPYVLADQIGNWLEDWKRPPQLDDYANAPKLRDLPRGEQLFRTRCAVCHSLAGQDPKDALGPDLLGVTRIREPAWLLKWLKAPDEMIKSQDPVAIALFEKYNRLAMPNLRLNNEEAVDLINFLDDEADRLLGKDKEGSSTSAGIKPGSFIPKSFGVTRPSGDVVAIMNAWVRELYPPSDITAGYMTLVNPAANAITLTGVQCDAFKKVEMHEMAKVNGMMRMRAIDKLVIPAGGQLQLKPGGMHLMLFEPQEDVAVGQKVDLVLVFESGARQTITLGVEDR